MFVSDISTMAEAELSNELGCSSPLSLSLSQSVSSSFVSSLVGLPQRCEFKDLFHPLLSPSSPRQRQPCSWQIEVAVACWHCFFSFWNSLLFSFSFRFDDFLPWPRARVAMSSTYSHFLCVSVGLAKMGDSSMWRSLQQPISQSLPICMPMSWRTSKKIHFGLGPLGNWDRRRAAGRWGRGEKSCFFSDISFFTDKCWPCQRGFVPLCIYLYAWFKAVWSFDGKWTTPCGTGPRGKSEPPGERNTCERTIIYFLSASFVRSFFLDWPPPFYIFPFSPLGNVWGYQEQEN